MKYPQNKLAQLVIASCVANKIEDVVISPGSRNAPLTIGFTSNPKTKTYSIVDERCAGFVAMGMSQKTNVPSALVCTSGSALLNYYPAVSEAFYSRIPLLVISADRPKHLIDVGDGQTIRQENVFQNHILGSFNLSESENAFEENKAKLYAAIALAKSEKGPVHINVPFDEPLYDLTDVILSFDTIKEKEPQELEEQPLAVEELETYASIWNNSNKKIVLIGVHQPDELLQTQINHLLKDPSVLVLTETTSNINNEGTINNIDQLISSFTEQDYIDFQPDVLLSLGGLVVSKRIKQLFRKYKPKHHWVIHPQVDYDTFFAKTKYFKISSTLFFSQFFWLTKSVDSEYQKQWLSVKEDRKQKHVTYLEQVPYSDFKVFNSINTSFPDNIVTQFANSSIIRYAQLFDKNDTVHVFCNRGTSGIDGSTSTALGYAVKEKKQVVLVTGDISFLYDSNALWNAYIPSNFRIILVNNNGGGIFKILPGPKKSDALSYFETPHGLTASHLAKMYNFQYLSASSEEELNSKLLSFYNESEQPKILEVFTPSDCNDEVLTSYFKSLSKG